MSIIGNRLADTAKLEIRKLTPEQTARMQEIWKNQFRIPTGKPDNHTDNIYATVKVNGQVVATLYNSGCAETSNATYGDVRNLPSMGEGETLTGPELAQKRAEEIARKMGGTVEKAATALKPGQWAPAKAEWTYDYEAMAAAQAAMDAAAKTRFETQAIGQNNNPSGDSVTEKFMTFMDSAHKGPGAFMRAQILASKGLTEESFAALSPEEQEKILEEIRKAIEEAVKRTAGMAASGHHMDMAVTQAL